LKSKARLGDDANNCVRTRPEMYAGRLSRHETQRNCAPNRTCQSGSKPTESSIAMTACACPSFDLFTKNTPPTTVIKFSPAWPTKPLSLSDLHDVCHLSRCTAAVSQMADTEKFLFGPASQRTLPSIPPLMYLYSTSYPVTKETLPRQIGFCTV
jgi:hypothetical protein